MFLPICCVGFRWQQQPSTVSNVRDWQQKPDRSCLEVAEMLVMESQPLLICNSAGLSPPPRLGGASWLAVWSFLIDSAKQMTWPERIP